MSFGQSSGQPDAFPPTLNISVHFIADSPLQLQMKHVMKNSVASQHLKNIPSLFQVAAYLDGFVPANLKSPPQKRTPVDDLKVHPEKMKAKLKAEERSTGQKSAKSAVRMVMQKNRANDSVGRPYHSPGEFKNVDFFLDAPLAKSVKLAADFTDWEKSPLEMVKTEEGVWHALVPLPPGEHSYRFIVDDQWCDDPRPAMWVPNPFGTINAVVTVT